jgi:hypothetical protein
MNEVVSEDSLNYNVYLLDYQNIEDYFFISPYDSIENPYDTSWIFFIDIKPDYGWSHPCMYVFVNLSTGNYSIRNACMPPLYYWKSWEKISVPFPHQSVMQYTDTTEYVSSEITPDPHKYALLISWDAWEDSARWNNLSHIYTGLKNEYGFMDENIFVLSDDGVFNPDSANLNLDGIDDFNDFDGPCTKEYIIEIFDYLDSVMTDEDLFLFYATTHGDTNSYGDDTTHLRLHDYEKLLDYELSDLVDQLYA